MKALKKSEKFDTVLRYLKNRQNTEVPADKISDYVQSTCPGFHNDPNVSGILKNLSSDQYVKNTDGGYMITFEGAHFLEDGGYTFNNKNYNRQQSA